MVSRDQWVLMDPSRNGFWMIFLLCHYILTLQTSPTFCWTASLSLWGAPSLARSSFLRILPSTTHSWFKSLSLSKPIHSCYFTYCLHPKAWATIISLRSSYLSPPGFPQAQKRVKVHSCLCRPLSCHLCCSHFVFIQHNFFSCGTISKLWPYLNSVIFSEL